MTGPQRRRRWTAAEKHSIVQATYEPGATVSLTREVGLEPSTTPVQSTQSNGMAEAFVRTIKRDYVRVSPIPDVRTVMECLPL